MSSQEPTTTVHDAPDQPVETDLVLSGAENVFSVATTMPRSIFTLSNDHLERMKLLASMVAQSQLAVNKNGSNKMTQGDVFLVMLKGIELGIEPMAALDSIDLISGKPTLDPQGMLALIHKSGQLDDIKIDSTDERCTVTMKRRNKTPHTEVFGVTEATRYMTSEGYGEHKKVIPLIEKANYKNQPKVMFKWRAVSACARVVFPDIIQGLYTPEELGADVLVDDAGKMIVITPVPQQPKPTNRPAAQPSQKPAPQADQSTPPQQEQSSEPPGESISKSTQPESHAWANDEKIVWMLNYMPTKLDGITGSDIARYTGIEYLKNFDAWNEKYATAADAMTAIKAAYDADIAAAANAQPATPKTSRFEKATWTEAQIDEMDALAGRFYDPVMMEPLKPAEALRMLDKTAWTDFGDVKVATTALRTMCIQKVMPIIAHRALYVKPKTKYSELTNGILDVRKYCLGEELKKLGADWEAYVEAWEKGQPYTFLEDEMPNLIVSWKLDEKDSVPVVTKIEAHEIAF